jgi:hypothetical protein
MGMYIVKLKYRRKINHVRSIAGTGETERCGSHIGEEVSNYVVEEKHDQNLAIAALKIRFDRDPHFEFIEVVDIEDIVALVTSRYRF